MIGNCDYHCKKLRILSFSSYVISPSTLSGGYNRTVKWGNNYFLKYCHFDLNALLNQYLNHTACLILGCQWCYLLLSPF